MAVISPMINSSQTVYFICVPARVQAALIIIWTEKSKQETKAFHATQLCAAEVRECCACTHSKPVQGLMGYCRCSARGFISYNSKKKKTPDNLLWVILDDGAQRRRRLSSPFTAEIPI